MLEKNKKILQKIFIFPQRYIMSVLSLLLTLVTFQMRYIFPTVITEMVIMPTANETDSDLNFCPDLEYKSSDVEKFENSYVRDFDNTKFNWSQDTQNILLGGSSWGFAISLVVSGIISDRFGPKIVITLGLLCTSVVTMLIPLAAKAGVPWIMTTIIVSGFGDGMVYPAICVLLNRWVPIEERGFIGGAVVAAAAFGQFTSNLLIGLILNVYSGDWEIVYYIFGGTGIFSFVIAGLLVYSEPGEHPFIIDEEVKYLSQKIKLRAKAIAPWKKILTSLPVWSYMISNAAIVWSRSMLTTYYPSYLKKILKFSVIEDSYIFSLPAIVVWISAMGFGWITDVTIRRKWLTITNTRKSLVTFCHVGNTISLLAASYSGCDRIPAVVFFTLSSVFTGPLFSSSKVNAMELSPDYAGSLLTLVFMADCLILLIDPYLVTVLAPNYSIWEWNTIYWIGGAFQIVAIVFYLIFGSGEVQPWNFVKSKSFDTKM